MGENRNPRKRRWLHRKIYRAIPLILIILTNCSIPEIDIVRSLRFEPPLFDSFKQNTKLKFTLLKPAIVSIYIKDTNGNIIKTIAVDLHLTQGTQSHGWKGDTDRGLFAPAGKYIGVVDVKNNKKYMAEVEIFHW